MDQGAHSHCHVLWAATRPHDALQVVSCAHPERIRVDRAWLSATSAAQGACVRSGRRWSCQQRVLGARIRNLWTVIVMVHRSVRIALPGSTALEGLHLPLRAFLAAFRTRRGPSCARFASREAILQVALRRVLPVRMGSTRTMKARASAYPAHIRSAATVAVLSVQKPWAAFFCLIRQLHHPNCLKILPNTANHAHCMLTARRTPRFKQLAFQKTFGVHPLIRQGSICAFLTSPTNPRAAVLAA